MALKKPITSDRDTGQLREVRHSEDLDITLEPRFVILEARFNALVFWMAEQGFEIPDELILDPKNYVN